MILPCAALSVKEWQQASDFLEGMVNRPVRYIIYEWILNATGPSNTALALKKYPVSCRHCAAEGQGLRGAICLLKGRSLTRRTGNIDQWLISHKPITLNICFGTFIIGSPVDGSICRAHLQLTDDVQKERQTDRQCDYACEVLPAIM